MTSKNFLKPKKFNIKAKSIRFESVRFMSDLEKAKVYVNFVSFLNNHFSYTTFKKNLYQHFHLHCGFIAHCNINGFYGEYFETAAKYHQVVNNVTPPQSEYCGIDMRKPNISQGESFYAIYEEINGSRNGLGDFIDTLINNRNYGGYSEYKDLDDAIREAISEYMEIWREKIREAIKAFDQFSKNEDIKKLKEEKEDVKQKAKELLEKANEIERKMLDTKAKQEDIKQKVDVKKAKLTLFDFMAA